MSPALATIIKWTLKCCDGEGQAAEYFVCFCLLVRPCSRLCEVRLYKGVKPCPVVLVFCPKQQSREEEAPWLGSGKAILRR